MAYPTRRFRADDAFAAAVRPARTAADITQAELAERVGVPTAAIAKIEQGSRRATVGEALWIAYELGTTVEVMVGDWQRPLVKASPGRPRRGSTGVQPPT
jgi:transcriptional regulator with XRE-family HTH domain